METITITGQQEITLDGICYEVDFEATAEIIDCQACISGPPENCHPDESECNINEIKVTKVSTEFGSMTIGEGGEEPYAKALDEDKITAALWEKYYAGR